MMFVGAIPRETCEQIARVTDFTTVDDAYVCCSGSFRFEHALAKMAPELRVHSNDVSALSCALGWYAAGKPVPFRFVRELAFIQEAIGENADRLDVVAGLTLALRMCHFRGHSRYVQEQTRHHHENAATYIGRAREKLQAYLAGMKVESFFGGDFREHARAAVTERSMVFAWPPVIRGDYEKFYSLIHNNVEWSSPAYDVFDPKTLGSWMDTLAERGTRYVVCCYTDLSAKGGHHKPVAVYTKGRSKAVFTYSNVAQRSSVRKALSNAEPFRYKLPDVTKLREDSLVQVVAIDSKRMNHIKDVFQLPGLVHTDGDMRFLVFVDGMLLGGFVYRKWSAKAQIADPRVTAGTTIYVLSDFSTTREGRVSKLIALLASGRQQTQQFDRHAIQRTKMVFTTAFANNPISMKYRGIYELYSRKPLEAGGWKYQLNYMREVDSGSNDDIYGAWYHKHLAASRRKGGGGE